MRPKEANLRNIVFIIYYEISALSLLSVLFCSLEMFAPVLESRLAGAPHWAGRDFVEGIRTCCWLAEILAA
jgi:hypothetical protein